MLEYYVPFANVFAIQTDEKGRMYIACRETPDAPDIEITILTPEGYVEENTEDSGSVETNVQKPTIPAVEKTELKLATMQGTFYISDSLIQFNKSNPKYKVSSLEFVTGEVEDRLNRKNAAMSSVNPPDLIGDLNNFSYYNNYIEQGYLEDLTPYFEKSSLYKKDDFLSEVWDAYTVEGKIYALPTRFRLYIPYCSSEFLEGKTGWTIEEFLDFMEKYPEAIVWNEGETTNLSGQGGKRAILGFCMSGINEAFVDWKNGTAHFEKERFRSILERINRIEVTALNKTMEARVADGEALLFVNGQISDNNEFARKEKTLTNGGELVLIGYPTAEKRTVGAGSISYVEAIGIASNSENKEGAWQFIETFLGDAFVYKEHGAPYATSKEGLAQKLAEGTTESDETDEYGNKAEENTGEVEITPGQVAKLEAAIRASAVAERVDGNITNIIYDEVATYFAGEKSLDDVVALIQNRVQLYLDEQN